MQNNYRRGNRNERGYGKPPHSGNNFKRKEKKERRTISGGIKFKLYIEYEGTRYSGWQIQQNARSIQGKILEAAEKLFKTRDIELYGSGRTDAGVHALCQVAHLEVNTMLAPEIIRMKLNDELPADINILEVEKTDPSFHARHDAEYRSYIYQISKRRSAFAKPFVWWIKDKLNVERMKTAAEHFAGMKDFASFAEKDEQEKSTKVNLNGVFIEEDGDLILIKISGSHFLWKMVRRIVGVLVEVGRGNLSERDVKGFLESFSEEPAKYTAPPSGLFLENIYYPGEKRESKSGAFISVKSFRSIR